jgi:hypothetical protein
MSKNTQLGNLVNGIFVDSTGRVGVGTQSPNHPLTVKADSSANGINIIAETGGFAQLSLSNAGNTLIGNAITQVPNSTSFDMYFSTYNGTSRTTKMVINGAGNVGIGTTSPSAPLHVFSTAAVTAVFTRDLTTDVSLRILSDNSGAILDTQGVHSLRFQTSDTERMRITSGGNMLMSKNSVIGINTDDGADDGYLALSGASADGPTRGGYIYLSGNERASDPGHVTIGAGNVIGIGSVITFRTAGTERMRLIGNGRLLIGTSTDQGYLLFVNGNAAGTSGFANVSDGRLKKDIVPIENALNKVNKLNGVSFNWDKDSRTDLTLDDNNHLGLIAQDVEKILPQVVSTGDDELQTKTITYSDIVPVLIEAIKELSKEIEILKQK